MGVITAINILHLSDIHFRPKGREIQKTFYRQVKTKMIEAIKHHLDKNQIELDVVAVTGDIAFSGKTNEYREAKDFFNKLKSQLSEKTIFLVVPGNHDVDRDTISGSFSLHSIVQDQKINGLLENKKEMNFFVKPKFKAFKTFVEDICPNLYETEEDYFWVKNAEDKGVSFLGLNSCWACENDDDKNKISLGYPQVMDALKKSQIENRVLLMHHPPMNWLNENDFRQYEVEIFENCGLILHGHTHFDNVLVFYNPSASCICLGANASYTNEKDGFIGFQFIRTEFRQEGVAGKVWPYRLEKRGHFRFVPDRNRWIGQEEKPYFVLKTFERSLEPGIKPPDTKPPLPPIPQKYKEWVKRFHSLMDIDLLAKKGEVINVSLPEIYIPIETLNPFYMKEQEKKKKNEKLTSKETIESEYEANFEKIETGDKEPPAVDIETLVGRKKLILLRGGAGMGKTTLVKHLAYTIIHDTCPSSLMGYLPVMVFLKDLWLIYKEEVQKRQAGIVFEYLLKLYFKKIKCLLTWETVSDFMTHQKVLFLIDGLDEVSNEFRSDLVEIMAQFQFENKDNRFLFTGRPHGISGQAAAHFGDDLHDIEPLTQQLVEDFIYKWFKAVFTRAKGIGEGKSEGMISDIRQQKHISVFTQNPLLLTAVCILYRDGKRIPDQRAELYNRIIDNLIYRRFHDPAHPDKENEICGFLMHLAFKTQEKNRKTFEINDALESLKRIYPRGQGEREGQYKNRILNLFNEIEPKCGLLNSLSTGEIEFTHLTFQEFLAAKYMENEEVEWEPFLEKEWWEETLMLFIGFMSINRKRKCNEIIKTISTVKQKHKKHSHRLQMMAGKALYDLQPSKREKQAVSHVRNRLFGLIESNANIQERFQVGVLVGGLGDTRIKPDNMTRVPEGEFIRGSNELTGKEKPTRRIFLDAFMIGVYPVTNQEFKRFIDDKGYNREEFWTSGGWEWRCAKNVFEPESWHNRKWNGPNFPVVGVSWYEADAYAKWFSNETKTDYRLPTETEWEKAARGTDGKLFPWGNEFDKNLCNSQESGLGHTSPVGIFPNGKSEFGCFDMAGNVWEWCADWFAKEYYKNSPAKNPGGPANGSFKVVRGGSWLYSEWHCRAAYRAQHHPSSQFNYIGFRLVRSV